MRPALPGRHEEKRGRKQPAAAQTFKMATSRSIAATSSRGSVRTFKRCRPPSLSTLLSMFQPPTPAVPQMPRCGTTISTAPVVFDTARWRTCTTHVHKRASVLLAAEFSPRAWSRAEARVGARTWIFRCRPLMAIASSKKLRKCGTGSQAMTSQPSEAARMEYHLWARGNQRLSSDAATATTEKALDLASSPASAHAPEVRSDVEYERRAATGVGLTAALLQQMEPHAREAELHAADALHLAAHVDVVARVGVGEVEGVGHDRGCHADVVHVGLARGRLLRHVPPRGQRQLLQLLQAAQTATRLLALARPASRARCAGPRPKDVQGLLVQLHRGVQRRR
eukprot:scaffold3183_cov381-Prasinococcus_capsulatus_cf.AAC.24